MKIKNLLFAGVGLVLMSGITHAQSVNDREKIAKSVKTPELQKLQIKFQLAYNASEEKVRIYLLNNPNTLRSFVKNGSVYYLKSINASGNPVYINSKNRESASLIKADQLYSGGSIGASITGEGMVAGIWDTGEVRSTHELLTGKVTMQPGQTVTGFEENYGGANHMTHVSGTMVGRDIAGKPRGIAHGATSLNYDPQNDATEMLAFAAQGRLISNHSYGMTNDTSVGVWLFGAYNEDSKAWDEITKNAPFYLPFIAGGNEQTSNGNMSKEGYDIMTGTSAAKNVMTVGALDGDKSMSNYSNWGPTDDGRLKPEIVARGTGINSSNYAIPGTSTPSDTSYSGNGVSSSGTSYSSPAAAASGLLLQQYYRTLNPTFMHASTLKALMLATAEDLGQPGPDNKFGWGLLNVEAAANAIKTKSASGNPTSASVTDVTSRGSYIEEISFNPASNSTEEMVRNVYAAGGTEPLIISIAWTDDAGVEQLEADGIDPTTSRLVYDFDMLVNTSANANIFRPWKPSTMATRTNAAGLQSDWFDGNGNNYKQIKITSPAAGEVYVIRIRKKTGSPALARMVSLIVTGTSLTPGTITPPSTPPIIPPTNIISTISAVNYQLFPNPNSGSFVLETSNSGEYSISAIDGKVLSTGKYITGKTTINTNLSRGIYFVSVSGSVKKLIIE